MANYRNYEVPEYGTLKEMLAASTAQFADRPAFREKADGVWREKTYREYGENVNALGTELLAQGFGGKRIIVTGINSYAWVVTYMAVICGVGVIVPVDKEIPAEELANIAHVSEAALVVYGAKSAEKVETLPPEVARCSFAKLSELIRAGKRRIADGDRAYLDATVDPNVMSALIFTSGTTGVSKGVMLSHRNLCFDIHEARQMLFCGPKDVCLSVLPLHHVYECTVGFLAQLWSGSSVAFSEGVRYISRNMQEVHPTIVLCVPLLLETLYSKLWLNIRKNGLEGKVRAMIKATNAIPGERARMMAKKSVFRAIHKNFGGKLRIMASGGASVDPEILRGLRDLGLLAIQGYGLTECSPIAAVNRDTYYRDSSAGLAMPNVLLDIYDVQDDGTGEIRVRGDNVMLGYYGMPELPGRGRFPAHHGSEEERDCNGKREERFPRGTGNLPLPLPVHLGSGGGRHSEREEKGSRCGCSDLPQCLAFCRGIRQGIHVRADPLGAFPRGGRGKRVGSVLQADCSFCPRRG